MHGRVFLLMRLGYSFVSSVDTSAVHALEYIAGELAKPGRLRPPLCLAACRDEVREVLKKSMAAVHALGGEKEVRTSRTSPTDLCMCLCRVSALVCTATYAHLVVRVR